MCYDLQMARGYINTELELSLVGRETVGTAGRCILIRQLLTNVLHSLTVLALSKPAHCTLCPASPAVKPSSPPIILNGIAV